MPNEVVIKFKNDIFNKKKIKKETTSSGENILSDLFKADDTLSNNVKNTNEKIDQKISKTNEMKSEIEQSSSSNNHMGNFSIPENINFGEIADSLNDNAKQKEKKETHKIKIEPKPRTDPIKISKTPVQGKSTEQNLNEFSDLFGGFGIGPNIQETQKNSKAKDSSSCKI